MASTRLVQLPRDVAQTIKTFLEKEERTDLASVCRVMAASEVFNPLKTGILMIPPIDKKRAQRFLRSLHPTRLARLSWIQLSQPWHVDLLVESRLVDAVGRVRVRPHTPYDTNEARIIVEAICEKVIALSNLKALDLAGTPIVDVASVGKLTHLRWLDLSQTQVVDISLLSAMTQLEDFVCREPRVTDLHCINTMIELRRLDVHHRYGSEVMLPSLSALRKLESLRVGTVIIESIADFSEGCSKLKHLEVNNIYVRSRREAAQDNLLYTNCVPVETLVSKMCHLHEINAFRVPTRALSKITSLRVVHHTQYEDFESLIALQSLEYLQLDVRSLFTHDHHFLLELPNLKILYIDEYSIGRNEVDPISAPAMLDFLKTVGTIPHLERLHLECKIVSDVVTQPFDSFRNLKKLTLAYLPEVESLACLLSCRLLTSLTLTVFLKKNDFSAIGTLTQLEELDLTFSSYKIDGFPGHQTCSFLHRLQRLKSLRLDGNLKDLAVLYHLVKLRRLTIHNKSNKPMKNQHVLGRFQFLHELDIGIVDVGPLLSLKYLRTVRLPSSADCRVFTKWDHPSLLYVLHRNQNCLGAPSHTN